MLQTLTHFTPQVYSISVFSFTHEGKKKLKTIDLIVKLLSNKVRALSHFNIVLLIWNMFLLSTYYVVVKTVLDPLILIA